MKSESHKLPSKKPFLQPAGCLELPAPVKHRVAARSDSVHTNCEQVHTCGATPTWLLPLLFLLLLPSSLFIRFVQRLDLTGAKACCRQLCQSLQFTSDGLTEDPCISKAVCWLGVLQMR